MLVSWALFNYSWTDGARDRLAVAEAVHAQATPAGVLDKKLGHRRHHLVGFVKGEQHCAAVDDDEPLLEEAAEGFLLERHGVGGLVLDNDGLIHEADVGEEWDGMEGLAVDKDPLGLRPRRRRVFHLEFREHAIGAALLAVVLCTTRAARVLDAQAPLAGLRLSLEKQEREYVTEGQRCTRPSAQLTLVPSLLSFTRETAAQCLVQKCVVPFLAVKT